MPSYKNSKKLIDLVGNTSLLKIHSLSEITGSEIYLKCEWENPGGTIKDRAAKSMVMKALETGELKPGMTIVEGTAGNTGIGLAIAAKSFGLKMLTVMPKGQAIEKERMITLFGAEIKLVDPCPFKDENHFYHTARRLGEENENYWWANQFENTANFEAHYNGTALELVDQFDGELDYFVCAAGTGGSIGGTSKRLKEKIKNIQCYLVDPMGSGLAHFYHHGEFKSEGGSLTEGIGIMRETANFKKAELDGAFNLADQELITLARYVRDHDGIVLGPSSALNLLGAFKLALKARKGSRLVSFMCDLGERSYSKFWNEEFLISKGHSLDQTMDEVQEKIAS